MHENSFSFPTLGKKCNFKVFPFGKYVGERLSDGYVRDNKLSGAKLQFSKVQRWKIIGVVCLGHL